MKIAANDQYTLIQHSQCKCTYYTSTIHKHTVIEQTCLLHHVCSGILYLNVNGTID